MKYILFIIILFAIVIQAQDVPSGYTTNLKLRLYDLDDYPGADSLNANAQLIDAGYKRNRDSLAALQTDVYGVIKYTGGLKAAVVTTASLATEVDTSRVKTTGNDAIYGSKYFYSTMYLKTVYPTANNLYNIGSWANRHQFIVAGTMYANEYKVYNPTGSDSSDAATITYNGTKVSFNKPVSISSLDLTGDISLDSGTVFNSFILGVDSYSPITVADTIITLAEGAAPIVHFILPGNLTTGTSRLAVSPATTGQILILRNATVPYTIKLVDYVGNDDNLYLAGDFTMGYNDVITLMCISETPAQAWVEVSRSNN